MKAYSLVFQRIPCKGPGFLEKEISARVHSPYGFVDDMERDKEACVGVAASINSTYMTLVS